MEEPWDCIVVGAGAAGLGTLLGLGWSLSAGADQSGEHVEPFALLVVVADEHVAPVWARCSGPCHQGQSRGSDGSVGALS